jgi:DNA-binding NtrC family response regulator
MAAATILVVDGDSHLLGYMSDALEELGTFHVETASDGKSAFNDISRRIRPAL